MKLTNFAVVRILNTLNHYSAMKLPQKISYAITRNYIIVQKEYEYYEHQLQHLFENYSEHMIKDEDGKVQTSINGIPYVDESVRKEFNEQVSELLNIEIEINTYTIDNSVFDYDNSKGNFEALSADDIMTLEAILCTTDDNEDKSDEKDTEKRAGE